MAKALENVKVLDFTRYAAGPFCTMVLRDLGAEVIKVEIPESGDAVRGSPPFTKAKESGVFIILNRGKKSITLNLTKEKGRQMAVELVKKVDVIVENFSVGVMDRLGLGYEKLAKINPGLIYASISGYGQYGPRKMETSYDVVSQAMGGLISVTGFPNGGPIKAGPAVADLGSGLWTVIAILSALQYRNLTGEGQVIDISMQDCVWAMTAPEFAPIYFLENKIPPKLGNGTVTASPFGIYPAKDGDVAICLTTIGQWEVLLKVLGREDLSGDPRYSAKAGRVAHREEVDAMVIAWTKERTVDDIVKTLNAVGLPCSHVPTFDQVANDPQLLARKMVLEVDQAVSGKVKVPGSVFKMSKTPGDVDFPAPFLGEHNYDVFSRLLGYSEPEIRSLADEGVI